MSQLPESFDPGLGGVADDLGRVRAALVPVAGLDGAGVDQGGHEAALDDLVDNMLAVMADHLSWVPPDFLP